MFVILIFLEVIGIGTLVAEVWNGIAVTRPSVGSVAFGIAVTPSRRLGGQITVALTIKLHTMGIQPWLVGLRPGDLSSCRPSRSDGRV